MNYRQRHSAPRLDTIRKDREEKERKKTRHGKWKRREKKEETEKHISLFSAICNKTRRLSKYEEIEVVPKRRQHFLK